MNSQEFLRIEISGLPPTHFNGILKFQQFQQSRTGLRHALKDNASPMDHLPTASQLATCLFGHPPVHRKLLGAQQEIWLELGTMLFGLMMISMSLSIGLLGMDRGFSMVKPPTRKNIKRVLMIQQITFPGHIQSTMSSINIRNLRRNTKIGVLRRKLLQVVV